MQDFLPELGLSLCVKSLDKRDALALLELARKQEIHPPPPINPVKVAYAFAVIAAGTLEDGWEQPAAASDPVPAEPRAGGDPGPS
jgi:hypothetical protein